MATQSGQMEGDKGEEEYGDGEAGMKGKQCMWLFNYAFILFFWFWNWSLGRDQI